MTIVFSNKMLYNINIKYNKMYFYIKKEVEVMTTEKEFKVILDNILTSSNEPMDNYNYIKGLLDGLKADRKEKE